MSSSKKLVMVGCLAAGWEVVKTLLEAKILFSAFVCITPEKAARAQVSGYKNFDDLALQYGIPIYYAEKYTLKSEQDIAFFRKHQFDLLVQGGWQRLFPEELLNTLSVGAIGIHGSSEFLPKGRGRSPINWSLIEGKQRFIMHYFLIKPGIDDGDVFYRGMFDINEWDDCRTLYLKNSVVTEQVMLKWIPKLLEGNFQVIPQNGEPSYYPKRVKEDGKVDWRKTVFEIYNFIRALTRPYPGAYTFVNGQRVNLWRAQPFDTRISYTNALEGQVVKIFADGDLLINCCSGLLLVTEYECESVINTNDIFK